MCGDSGDTETVDVDAPAGLWIAFGKVAFVDRGSNGFRIVVQDVLDKTEITDSRCHQDVGLRAAGNEKARHVVTVRLSPLHILPRTRHVLRCRRFMVNVASVDFSSMIEQKSRDVDCRCKMQWQLAVTAARINKLRVVSQELADTVDHAQPCCRMDIHDGAARDEIICQVQNLQNRGLQSCRPTSSSAR